MATDAFRFKERSTILPSPDRQWFYGYLKIGVDRYSIASRTSKLIDVFTEGRAEIDPRRVVLGRRIDNDDKLILAKSLTSLCGEI